MEFSTYLIVLGVLLFLALLLIGGGIALMRSQRGQDEDRIAGEKKALLRDAGPAAAGGRPKEAAQDAGTSGAVEILRVWRDPVDGRLSVRLRGETAAAAEGLSAGQRDQLRRVVAELAGWLERPVVAGDAPEEVAVQSPPEPERPLPFAATLPDEPELADLMPFRKKEQPKLPEEPAPPRSIAAQIDEILQEKLAASPLAGQTVRLSEDLGGGLKIIVGDHQYQGIDEVAEPDVRALIKSAVREWNEKNRLNPNAPRG